MYVKWFLIGMALVRLHQIWFCRTCPGYLNNILLIHSKSREKKPKESGSSPFIIESHSTEIESYGLVAQLVEQSLPKSEIPSSNQVIGKIHTYVISTVKEAGNGAIFKELKLIYVFKYTRKVTKIVCHLCHLDKSKFLNQSCCLPSPFKMVFQSDKMK